MEKITFTVLAVTKTYNQFCIAGMDQKGNWIRPLPPLTQSKFWSSISYNNGQLITVGDVWEITDYTHEKDVTSPGHTEDIRLNRVESKSFSRRLTNNELIEFVSKFQEGKQELEETLNAMGRSLCLISIKKFKQTERARIKFTFNQTEYINSTKTPGYPVTDLKWRAYLINNITFPQKYKSLFLTVGLARTEPSKEINREFPMVISLITDPYVELLDTYPY